MNPSLYPATMAHAQARNVNFGAFWNRKPKPIPLAAENLNGPETPAPVPAAPEATVSAAPQRTFMQKVKRFLKIGTISTAVAAGGSGVVMNIPPSGNVATIRDTLAWGLLPNVVPSGHVVRGEDGALYVTRPLLRYSQGEVDKNGVAYDLPWYLPIDAFKSIRGNGDSGGQLFNVTSRDKQVAVIDPTSGAVRRWDSGVRARFPEGWVNVEEGAEIPVQQLAALGLWTIDLEDLARRVQAAHPDVANPPQGRR